ncbi:MAG: sulfite exporter TauE/SafE family protein [Bacteroidia bacterium]|nr:sulfite exporter TauE/SafE family protein [Bacteroidia bacterium]
MQTLIISAVMMGFMGSLHCLGMCGPIALTLSVPVNSSSRNILKSVFYNSGRIITYGFLGIIFGSIGKIFSLAGFQQGLSVGLGLLLLAGLLFPALSKRFSPLQKIYTLIVHPVQVRIGEVLRKNTFRASFMVGIFNGFLPCGLVYVALAGAVATGDMLKGALFMMIFGAGTFPMMFLLGVLGQRLSFPFRQKFQKAVPLFIGTMAVLLILRGLNLGIPYLSPQFSEDSGKVKTSCCHKP